MGSSGIAVALNLSCFTFIGELLGDKSLFADAGLSVFLGFWGVLGAIGLLFSTNFAASIFDQVDVMPVY